MAICDLLTAFEGELELPVDVNRLAGWIVDNGIQDDIEFVGVELDTGVIRGFLHRFRYQKTVYGEPVSAANVYYAKNQEPEWINIVCAKELIHLTDTNNLVGGKAQFDTLIKRLVLPRDLKVLLQDPSYALSDKFGDAFAAAVLLPKACRDLLIKPYKNDIINAGDIARLADLPVHYVRMVMSDDWPEAYDRMRELGK